MRSSSGPSFFGDMAERKVTFLLDISASTYRTLDDIKDHLIKAITELSLKSYDTMFNIIAFSDDEVESFTSKVLPCTHRSVSAAASWIQ